MSSVMDRLLREMEVDEVVKRYQRIYLNGSHEEKQKHKEMLFLGDPNFDSKSWVSKALDEFNTNPELESIKEIDSELGLLLSPRCKCIFVKAFRNLHAKEIEITRSSVLEETNRLLGVN